MSIFRKRRTSAPEPDPVSGAAWKSALRATISLARAVGASSDIPESLAGTSTKLILARQLLAVTAATPAYPFEGARSPVPTKWSYADYLRLAEVGKFCLSMLASLVEDGVHDDTLSPAAAALSSMQEALKAYTKLIRTERAMERLSGEESERKR